MRLTKRGWYALALLWVVFWIVLFCTVPIYWTRS